MFQKQILAVELIVTPVLICFALLPAHAAGPNIESPVSQKLLEGLSANIKQHPNQPAPYVARARFWYGYEAQKRAKADLEQSIKVCPTAEAYLWLGKVSLNPPENKESLEYFVKARTLGGKDPQLLALLGEEYGALRLYGKAEEAYSAALSSKSLTENVDIFILSYRARTYLQDKKFSQAIADATLDLKRAQHVLPADKLSAQPLESKSAHSNTIELAMQRAYISAAKTRALAYVGLKDYTKALEYLNFAFKLAPGDVDLLDARALVYEKLGKPALAAKDRAMRKERMDFFYNNALFSSDDIK